MNPCVTPWKTSATTTDYPDRSGDAEADRACRCGAARRQNGRLQGMKGKYSEPTAHRRAAWLSLLGCALFVLSCMPATHADAQERYNPWGQSGSEEPATAPRRPQGAFPPRDYDPVDREGRGAAAQGGRGSQYWSPGMNFGGYSGYADPYSGRSQDVPGTDRYSGSSGYPGLMGYPGSIGYPGLTGYPGVGFPFVGSPWGGQGIGSPWGQGAFPLLP